MPALPKTPWCLRNEVEKDYVLGPAEVAIALGPGRSCLKFLQAKHAGQIEPDHAETTGHEHFPPCEPGAYLLGRTQDL